MTEHLGIAQKGRRFAIDLPETEPFLLPLPDGEVTEWPIVHPWKGCVLETEPRVRIPPSPPLSAAQQITRIASRDENVVRRSEAEMGHRRWSRSDGEATNPSLSAIERNSTNQLRSERG